MNRRGFTLLEILVCLAVLGMGVALIVEITQVAARRSQRVEEDTTVQIACQNMMNSILSGNMTATIGVSIPIPEAPNWETTIELLDGPIDKIVAIRITAQRYVTEIVPSYNGATAVETKTPDAARRFVVKEWARRAEIRTRVVKTNSSGGTTAVDGTGETVANDLMGSNDAFGGSLGGIDGFGDMGMGSETQADPFASIDASFGGANQESFGNANQDRFGGASSESNGTRGRRRSGYSGPVETPSNDASF